MSYITTYTGKHFDPVNPDASLLCIEDIAHALSLLCRGNGHVQTFFSVGQHCIACAKEAQARGLSARLILACLLHDASECYMSDVPRPFKQGNRNNRLLFCMVISSQMFFPCLILLCLIVYSFFVILIKHKYLNIHFPGKNIIVLWLFANKWNCFLHLK